MAIEKVNKKKIVHKFERLQSGHVRGLLRSFFFLKYTDRGAEINANILCLGCQWALNCVQMQIFYACF